MNTDHIKSLVIAVRVHLQGLQRRLADHGQRLGRTTAAYGRTFFTSVKNLHQRAGQSQRLSRFLTAAAVGLILTILLTSFAFGWLWSSTDDFDTYAPQEPSRLYGRPRVLAMGEQATAEALVAELVASGYRASSAETPPPGHFVAHDDRLSVALRPYPVPAGSFRGGHKLDVRFADGRVAALELTQGGSGGDQVARPRQLPLEPPLLATYYGPERRECRPVDLGTLPEHVQQAVLAAEDDAFLYHSGVSLPSVLRAAWVNLNAGEIRQGGSTITQQLARNLFLNHDRTFARKAQEALLALILELRYSKEQILEAYLNEVYWGASGSVNLIGLGSAAYAYFAKDPQELTLAESAFLAGILHGPGNYLSAEGRRQARLRRDWVLQRMASLGWITAEEARQAEAEPVRWSLQPLGHRRAPYFAAYVAQEAKERFGIEELTGGGYRLLSTLDVVAQEAAERAVRDNLEALSKRFGEGRPNQPLEAALVSVDPQRGEILSYVGGRDYHRSQFDRASHARRQAGSLFKPVVYAAAFSTGGTHPYDLVADTPIRIQQQGQAEWQPKNSDGRFHGIVTVREALERSLNVPTVRVAVATGLSEIAELGEQMGVDEVEENPAMTLGAVEVTPLEILNVYATLANGGTRQPLRGLRSVYDVTGEPVLPNHGTSEPERVLDYEPVYLVTKVLQGVLTRGTGRQARSYGIEGPVAGKTGTSDDRRDSWFAGYSPERATVVWVGYDDNAPTSLGGARAALPIWSSYTAAVAPPEGFRNFEQPSWLREAAIDPTTGYLATEFCPRRVVELFPIEAVPQEPCPIHTSYGTVSIYDDPTIVFTAGEPPLVYNSGAPPSNPYGGIVRARHLHAGEAPAEVYTGEAPAEVYAGEAPAEVYTGEAPAEVYTGEAPAEIDNGTREVAAPVLYDPGPPPMFYQDPNPGP